MSHSSKLNLGQQDTKSHQKYGCHSLGAIPRSEFSRGGRIKVPQKVRAWGVGVWTNGFHPGLVGRMEKKRRPGKLVGGWFNVSNQASHLYQSIIWVYTYISVFRYPSVQGRVMRALRIPGGQKQSGLSLWDLWCNRKVSQGNDPHIPHSIFLISW